MVSTSHRVERLDLVGEAAREAEEHALEAVRNFVRTVNGILPDPRDNRVRRQIIDSAVEMTQCLIGTSTELAAKVVSAATDPWVRPVD